MGGGEDPPGRRWWIAVTVAAAGLALCNVVGAVVLLVVGEWFRAALAALAVVGFYWFAAGSWLRTPWSELPEMPPPAPPELGERRARTYVALADLCVIACLMALAAQAMAGSW